MTYKATITKKTGFWQGWTVKFYENGKRVGMQHFRSKAKAKAAPPIDDYKELGSARYTFDGK